MSLAEKPAWTSMDKDHFVRRLSSMCGQVEKIIQRGSIEDIENWELNGLRRKIWRSCSQLIDDEEYGQRALEWNWRSCYYSLILRIRNGFSNILSEQQKQWSTRIMRRLIAELAYLANFVKRHSSRRALISVYIGDLYRYSYLLCSAERDRHIAILQYKEAVAIDSHLGLGFNQMGLLIQETEPATALMHFMLAVLAEHPFNGAYANILAFLTRAPSLQLRENADIISLITHCFSSFRALEFDEYRMKWMEEMHSKLGLHDEERVAFRIHLLALSAATLATKKENEVCRAICTMLLDISTAVIEAVEELAANVAASLMRKGARRRKASDSSQEETFGCTSQATKGGGDYCSDNEDDVVELSDDEEDDEYYLCSGDPYHVEKVMEKLKAKKQLNDAKLLLTALVHFTILNAKQLYAERTPGAIRSSFEEFMQRLTETLNSLMIDDANDKFVENLSDSDSNRNVPFWFISTGESYLLLPDLLRQLIQADYIPISFDKFFRYAPITSKKDTVMQNMAKLRLECRAKQEEARSMLPIYVVPEHDVVLERLNVLRSLLRDKRLDVIIAEDTLRFFDKIKKGDIRAREAIRWLQKGLYEHGDYLAMHKADSVRQCADNLVTSSSHLDNPLIVAVLTMDQMDEQYDQKPFMLSAKISRENVDRFEVRYKYALKDNFF
ncbi:unnamed protein product [Anisakis simplex]|uniref:TPR_REGION domain-containing protein n=1 Tax=Anisakis simplex TaxID=6269 RepID=A0A0M3IXX6_ANISI|nr:unnamed protein product [Anisakis simplex]